MPTVEGTHIGLPGRDLRLYVRDWGGKGSPIVLLHGLSSNSRIWDWTAPLLAQSFRVLAVDQRGHGLSDSPDGGYDFASVAADLVALIETLALDRPVVVGHSWGASVALQFASDKPDAVGGIVMVDGAYIERFGETWEEAEKQMRPPEIDGTTVERFIEFMRKWPQIRDAWSPELGEMVLSNFEVRDGKIYRRLSIPNHMKIARAIFNQSPSELFAALRVPALVIPAMTAPSNDFEQRWHDVKTHGIGVIQGVRPDLKVAVMEDTIHDVPLQRPRELADLIVEFASSVAR